MNYRHAFHAGNFADVVKHAVIARVIVHLKEKSTPFRVIDTHAGAGIYDLLGAEASRTHEWRDGVARLMSARFSEPVGKLL
jgi:23S rRNA (adenine2030-N6)-methyltransferase